MACGGLLSKVSSSAKSATNKVISKCKTGDKTISKQMSQTFWEANDKTSAAQAKEEEVSHEVLDAERANVKEWERRIREIVKSLNEKAAASKKKPDSKIPAATKLTPANGRSFMVVRDSCTGLFSVVSFKMDTFDQEDKNSSEASTRASASTSSSSALDEEEDRSKEYVITDVEESMAAKTMEGKEGGFGQLQKKMKAKLTSACVSQTVLFCYNQKKLQVKHIAELKLTHLRRAASERQTCFHGLESELQSLLE